MTLDDAHEQFTAKPTNKTAGQFLAVLVEYFEDGMIEESTFTNHVASVSHWLLT